MCCKCLERSYLRAFRSTTIPLVSRCLCLFRSYQGLHKGMVLSFLATKEATDFQGDVLTFFSEPPKRENILTFKTCTESSIAA